MSKWPIVIYIDRFGKKQTGELAYNGGDYVTVRTEAKLKKVEGKYGLIELSVYYIDVKKEFVCEIIERPTIDFQI